MDPVNPAGEDAGEPELDEVAVARLAASLALPPGWMLQPRALQLPDAASRGEIENVAGQLGEVWVSLPWACGDLANAARARRLKGVTKFFEKAGVSSAHLGHLCQTARRFPAELRSVPLPHTFYLLVAKRWNGYPSQAKARTAEGKRQIESWRRAAVKLLEEAHAEGIGSTEFLRHLRELQGKGDEDSGVVTTVTWRLLEKIRDGLQGYGCLEPSDPRIPGIIRLGALLRGCVAAAEFCLGGQKAVVDVDLDEASRDEALTGQTAAASGARSPLTAAAEITGGSASDLPEASKSWSERHVAAHGGETDGRPGSPAAGSSTFEVTLPRSPRPWVLVRGALAASILLFSGEGVLLRRAAEREPIISQAVEPRSAATPPLRAAPAASLLAPAVEAPEPVTATPSFRVIKSPFGADRGAEIVSVNLTRRSDQEATGEVVISRVAEADDAPGISAQAFQRD